MGQGRLLHEFTNRGKKFLEWFQIAVHRHKSHSPPSATLQSRYSTLLSAKCIEYVSEETALILEARVCMYINSGNKGALGSIKAGSYPRPVPRALVYKVMDRKPRTRRC
jgi:hypothetical protein